MRAVLAALIGAIVLSGCAEDAPPMGPPPEPVYSDSADVPLGTPTAPIVWQTVWQSEFVLAPANPIRASMTLPEGTLQVLVNLTTDAGAIYGLQIDLGECHWKRDLAILARGGETWGADCGGLLPGSADLFVGTQAGAVAGNASVVSATCHTRMGRCPAPLPATTA